MRSRMMLVCAVSCLVLATCGSEESTSVERTETESTISSTATTVLQTTSTATPSVGQGCDVLHEPGEYAGLNVFDDVEQPYWVVVPETYQDVAPAPLYLWLAPEIADPDSMLEGWRSYLDDLDGLMVMVNGSQHDVLLSLVDQMTRDYCVEPTRIHVMGSSSQADEMACEAADRIASFTTMGTHLPFEDCTPSRPVPLWTFTGDPQRDAVTALVDSWIAINGCDPDPIVEDLGSGVSRKTYQDCDADVVFYDIEGMGRQWPVHKNTTGTPWAAEYEEVDYLEDTLRFFAEHPLP